MIRVLIVDDSEVFASAAAEVVASTPGFAPVATAGSGEEAVQLSRELRPDLVLLDVRMPGMGGIEAARQIRAARPDTRVILVTAEPPSAVDHSSCPDIVAKLSLTPRLLADLWHSHRPHGAHPGPLRGASATA